MEEDQEDAPGTAGSRISRRGLGSLDGSVRGWLLSVTCGVSSHVNLRRGDDTHR